ncbi:MAG: alpha/beta hydrolase [Bacteroidota bacterium]
MMVYFIPGLGFDHRMFAQLSFPGLSLTFIDWIPPMGQESIASYAHRLASIIPQDGGSVLVGHSFGGVLCQEIASQKDIRKIILLSSIQSREELPFHFKIVAPLRLEKLFTKELTIRTIKYWGKAHDYAKGEEQDLVKEMVGKYSNHYLQWALRTLSSWKGAAVPASTALVHIHGEQDSTLPIALIKQVDYRIKEAGHFMIYKRAKELSPLILQEIKRIS